MDEIQTRITVFDTMGRSITEKPTDYLFQPGVYIVKVASADFQAQKKVRITRYSLSDFSVYSLPK